MNGGVLEIRLPIRVGHFQSVYCTFQPDSSTSISSPVEVVDLGPGAGVSRAGTTATLPRTRAGHSSRP